MFKISEYKYITYFYKKILKFQEYFIVNYLIYLKNKYFLCFFR